MSDQTAYAVAMAGVFLAMFIAGGVGDKFKLSDGWRMVVLFVLWGLVFVGCQLIFVHFGYKGL